MARGSRHKSHRSHKHRDRSESDDEGNSRDRKTKVEEEESARVSRVSDQEKRKSSSKDGVGISNGDVSGDIGKKRKDRGEDSGIGGDRWNGGGDDEIRIEKESKKEGSDAVELEKSSKSKCLSVDLKGKSSSSRRREGSNEKNEEKRSERSEEKRRLEKEASRRENSSQYKDGKDKEREREKEKEKERERERERKRERERGSEKDKKVQDSRYERSDDAPSRREEHSLKQGVDISDLRDEMRTPEVEKELDKRIKRRRDGSGDQDRLDDVREGDDRQVSSRDHSKNGSYKDGRYKEKYRVELDRDQRHRDDKHSDDKRRDERPSQTHTSERSDSRRYRDESRVSESRDKKTKLQDSDHDISRRGDDLSIKLKDNSGRKRSSDEIEDHNQIDLKPRSSKEPREDAPKNGSSSGKFDSRSDRARMELPHTGKVDSCLGNSRTKNSPNSSAYAGKDENRHNSRQVESTRRESLSEDTRRSGAVSRDNAAASRGRERMSESRTLEKSKLRDNIRYDAFITDGGSVPHHDRIRRSGSRSSPNQLTERSPTSTSERRSERITARRSLDIDEGGQRSSSSKGGRGETLLLKDGGREREYLAEKPNEDDTSQVELLKREHVSVGSSSNRTAHRQGSSPGRLPPPPPVRYGVDSPSVLGSYDDETRVQNSEHKSNNRYKRDASVGREPGTHWKGAPTWPSTVSNGFMSLPHGPPGGFHPAIQQFPAPPLFGIRPSMGLSNASYHMHEAANRFPGHARPYGWHNPMDDCPPQLHVWDGHTSLFGDESHIYGRQEWDQSRHLLSGRGWETSTDTWNAQNGNANMEFPIPQKENEYSRQALADEAWVGQRAHNSPDEQARSEQPMADASGIKLSSYMSPAKQAVGAKSLSEKTPEPSKMSSVNGISEKQSDSNVLYSRTYLSKLDISRDLVQPELYKQCMSLMEARERNVAGNVSTLEQRKNNVEGLNVEGFRLVAKSKQYARDSFLPTATDATFQRAMALYKKQRERMREAIRLALPSVCSEGQNKPPESNDEEVATKSITHMEEGLPADAPGVYMEEDNNAAAGVEGEHRQSPGDTEEKLHDDNKPRETKAQQVDNPGDAEEKGSDKISDAVISVEGSVESEAIIPECRVNLSRIHLSPAESTH